MKGAPVSDQFDEVYFSAKNGLAETHHVFLKSNALEAAWQGGQTQDKRFVICETGFGTGLNFLAAIKLFDECAAPQAQMHYISFEKYPLAGDFIRDALAPFKDEIGPYLEKLLKRYPIRVPGFHRLSLDLNDGRRVFLTLIFDDMNDAIAHLNATVDAWFLDGFSPAKNPQMWSATLFANMARLSHKGTTFSTFTAARVVKDGLAAAGFDVQKNDGFEYKQDMLCGRFVGSEAGGASGGRHAIVGRKNSVPRIAIVGGGLAGSACAYALKRYGLSPVIYEQNKGLAGGASGNVAGLYNPRFSAYRSVESDFYTAGFAQILRQLPQFQNIPYCNVGALHLIHCADKEKRYRTMVEQWGWQDGCMQILDPQAASEIGGIDIKRSAVYLKDSGYVSPAMLCEAYAKDVDKVLMRNVQSLDDIDADIIILACASAAKDFVPWLPIYGVRGQVSEISETPISKHLKCNIHYSGYITPSDNGAHMIGATFQKECLHTDVLDADHHENLEQLKGNMPIFHDENFNVLSGRAGIRCSSHDHFPIAGRVPEMGNVFVSTAHASHGLVSSLSCANLIADMITGSPLSLPENIVKALNGQRFIDRAAKKGRSLGGL